MSYPSLLFLDFCRRKESDFFLEVEKIIFNKLIEMQKGGLVPIVFYFWFTNNPSIVLGVSQNASEEVHLENASASGVPVLKRKSGGGSVVHDKGNLCYSLFIPEKLHPELPDVSRSFFFLGEIFSRSLLSLGIDARVVPLSDIAVADTDGELKKVSGNAQWRRRGIILQHGTFLLDMDLEAVSKLLPEPAKQPEYRRKRNHRQFIRNLSSYGLDFHHWFPLVLQEIDQFLKSLADRQEQQIDYIPSPEWLSDPKELIKKAEKSLQFRNNFSKREWLELLNPKDIYREAEAQDRKHWFIVEKYSD